MSLLPPRRSKKRHKGRSRTNDSRASANDAGERSIASPGSTSTTVLPMLPNKMGGASNSVYSQSSGSLILQKQNIGIRPRRTGRYEEDQQDGPESSPTMMGTLKSVRRSASTSNLVRGGAGDGLYSQQRKRPFATGVHLPGLQMKVNASEPTLLGGVELDAESVRSENLNYMPMNLPLEVIQVRSEIEVQKIDSVMAKKVRRERRKMKKHQEKITEKYTRAQRYKEERERQELQCSWLTVLVHAFSLNTFPEMCRPHYEERMQELRVDALAERIQRMTRRTLLKKQWADLSKFIGHIVKCKWHFGLQIRCWRRYKAADLVTQFVLDASKLGDGCKVVAKFSGKIRRLQNVTKDFLAVTRGRIKVLGKMLDEVALEWVNKKQSFLDDDATMTGINIKVKKSNRFRKDQVQAINQTVSQWKKTDARFTAMVKKQKELGRCVISNKMRTVPFLSQKLAERVCWDVLHAARLRHVENLEGAFRKQHEAAKKVAGTTYSVDDVKDIIFPTNGGYVMKVNLVDNMRVEQAPFFFFWTSFKPKSIREVLWDAYEAAHLREYGDVVKKELDRRREKAMKGALQREEQNRRARAKRAALKRKLTKPSRTQEERKAALEAVAATAAKAREEAAEKISSKQAPSVVVTTSMEIVEIGNIVGPVPVLSEQGLRPSISRSGKLALAEATPEEEEQGE